MWFPFFFLFSGDTFPSTTSRDEKYVITALSLLRHLITSECFRFLSRTSAQSIT